MSGASDHARSASEPERREFDFWLGGWDLTWEPDGRGTNTITSILRDRVILEQFDGSPSIPLRGMSVSAFDPGSGRWKQTWVDSDGGYLDFVGGMAGDRMILERTAKPGVLQRMAWFDIEPESLRWNWERSTDDGATWKVVWAITYRRRDLADDPGGPAIGTIGPAGF